MIFVGSTLPAKSAPLRRPDAAALLSEHPTSLQTVGQVARTKP